MVRSLSQSGRGIEAITGSELAQLDTSTIPQFTSNSAYMELYNLAMAMSSVATIAPIAIIDPCISSVMSSSAMRKGNKKQGKWQQKHHTAISDNASLPVYLDVYPNPAAGTVMFDYAFNAAVRISVTDLLGKKVWDMQAATASGTAQWLPTGLPGGVYIYTATDGTGAVQRGKITLLR